MMSFQTRTLLYVIGNLIFMITVAVAATAQDVTTVNVGYLIALFALCTAPLLLLDGFNGRYPMLGILMLFYFLFFGMLDLVSVLVGGRGADAPGLDTGDLNSGECAILVGAVCILVGYCAAARAVPVVRRTAPAADWPQGVVFGLGLLLWAVGVAAMIYFTVYVVPQKTSAAAVHGFAAMGPGLTFIVMLGHMVAPLGIVILSYGYAHYRSMFWFVTILAVCFAMVGVAFVSDIRGQAAIAPAMIMVALTLTDNKIPRGWVVGTAVMIVIVFPILTAYRIEVSGERGMTREQAVQNLDKVIDVVLAYREKLASGSHVAGQTVFERLSLKANVELAVERTGVDRPFQNGGTLIAVPLAFIPRLIWPDKPDVATGLLFNHEFFGGGDQNTYISPSHLGELYWNFGWPGAVLGLLSIGVLLGLVAAKCCLAERSTVTRLLILLITINYLCMGFEGAMSISYILWLRSLALVGILHVLLARSQAPGAVAVAAHDEPLLEPALPRGSAARFPNIMA
jgi:hypothetical protein